MTFEIQYNEHGPAYVTTDDGFAQVSRPFDKARDGWMLKQLDPAEFPAIQTGRDVEWLVSQVNKLRRENYELQEDLKMWKTSALRSL